MVKNKSEQWLPVRFANDWDEAQREALGVLPIFYFFIRWVVTQVYLLCKNRGAAACLQFARFCWYADFNLKKVSFKYFYG